MEPEEKVQKKDMAAYWFNKGKAEQAQADRGVQLATFAHDEISAQLELLGMGQFRKVTGNFAMIAEKLEALPSAQYIKIITLIMDKAKRIFLYLYNLEKILEGAQWPEDRKKRTSDYIKGVLGSILSIFIAMTRSPRTMVAAESQPLKMTPERELKNPKERAEKAMEISRKTTEEVLEQDAV